MRDEVHVEDISTNPADRMLPTTVRFAVEITGVRRLYAGTFVVDATVADRDTGEPRRLEFSVNGQQTDNEADMLRTALLTFLEHEVDEAIKVEGKRVREHHGRDEGT